MYSAVQHQASKLSLGIQAPRYQKERFVEGLACLIQQRKELYSSMGSKEPEAGCTLLGEVYDSRATSTLKPGRRSTYQPHDGH